MSAAIKWSERLIGHHLATQVFNRKAIVLVPNCNWTGHECDILVVTTDLRVIDVEVKISRADLRKDAKKSKWYHWWDVDIDGPYKPGGDNQHRRRDWPNRVWKHYYAVPASVWADHLFTEIPDVSGVLLMTEQGGLPYVKCVRLARPCRDADRLSAAAAIDVARLANLRMWKAYKELEARHAG